MFSYGSGAEKSETGSYRAKLKVTVELCAFWTLQDGICSSASRGCPYSLAHGPSSTGKPPNPCFCHHSSFSPSAPILTSLSVTLTLPHPSYKHPVFTWGPPGYSRIIFPFYNPYTHLQGKEAYSKVSGLGHRLWWGGGVFIQPTTRDLIFYLFATI